MARAKTRLVVCLVDMADPELGRTAGALVPQFECDTAVEAEQWIRKFGEADAPYHLVRTVKVVTKRVLQRTVLE